VKILPLHSNRSFAAHAGASSAAYHVLIGGTPATSPSPPDALVDLVELSHSLQARSSSRLELKWLVCCVSDQGNIDEHEVHI
jgi:hypothetical protein